MSETPNVEGIVSALERGFGLTASEVVPSSPPSSNKPKLGSEKDAADYGQDKMGSEKDAAEKEAAEKEAKEKAAKEKAAKEKEAKQKEAMLHDKDEKIAVLTASVQELQNKLTIQQASGIIGKMLTARAQRGVPTEQLNAFAGQFYGKSIDEITAFYDNEKVLHAQPTPTSNPLVASSHDASTVALPTGEIPYEGNLTASLKGDTLEEMLK